MGLAGQGIMISQTVGANTPATAVYSNPGSLNLWLKSHQGYTPQNDLEENAIPRIAPGRIFWNETSGMHRTADLSTAAVRAHLDSGTTLLIANVLKGRHFVLGIGYDTAKPDVLYVHDSGFNTSFYSLQDDVVGWRIFTLMT